MNVVSLFANIGIGEAYLKSLGFNVIVANELEPRRADIYRQIYPETDMICGDITNKDVYSSIVRATKKQKIDVIMATPPCQGMSTAGKQDKFDVRNDLFLYAIKLIKDVKPDYFIFENVPGFMTTSILYNEEPRIIPDVIKDLLRTTYTMSFNIVDTQDYGVPQSRTRMILLGTHRRTAHKWVMPDTDPEVKTLADAIGDLPIVDPFIYDITEEEMLKVFPKYKQREKAALKISPWHMPPHHILRQVITMQHTATGCSAFDNEKYKPRKKNGEIVKGFHNTYSRQRWDTPAYTIAMSNNQISTQNSVHPGRYMGKDSNGDDIYSDPRVFTVYELMRIMSIPDDWPIPVTVSKQYLRHIIGEGVPSLLIKKLFSQIKNG
ncbi:MAG: DNA cytosine methyltransferase [Phocaeicola sp.]